MTPDELQALARAVAPLVVAQLASALGAMSEPFSTRAGHTPPEFKGRSKAWRAAAATIPGRARLGRWIVVPREAYAAWLRAQSEAALPFDLRPTPDAPWSPAAAVAEAGLRPSVEIPTTTHKGSPK